MASKEVSWLQWFKHSGVICVIKISLRFVNSVDSNRVESIFINLQVEYGPLQHCLNSVTFLYGIIFTNNLTCSFILRVIRCARLMAGQATNCSF